MRLLDVRMVVNHPSELDSREVRRDGQPGPVTRAGPYVNIPAQSQVSGGPLRPGPGAREGDGEGAKAHAKAQIAKNRRGHYSQRAQRLDALRALLDRAGRELDADDPCGVDPAERERDADGERPCEPDDGGPRPERFGCVASPERDGGGFASVPESSL